MDPPLTPSCDPEPFPVMENDCRIPGVKSSFSSLLRGEDKTKIILWVFGVVRRLHVGLLQLYTVLDEWSVN